MTGLATRKHVTGYISRRRGPWRTLCGTSGSTMTSRRGESQLFVAPLNTLTPSHPPFPSLFTSCIRRNHPSSAHHTSFFGFACLWLFTGLLVRASRLHYCHSIYYVRDGGGGERGGEETWDLKLYMGLTGSVPTKYISAQDVGQAFSIHGAAQNRPYTTVNHTPFPLQ
jgi:hypothetical protein